MFIQEWLELSEPTRSWSGCHGVFTPPRVRWRGQSLGDPEPWTTGRAGARSWSRRTHWRKCGTKARRGPGERGSPLSLCPANTCRGPKEGRGQLCKPGGRERVSGGKWRKTRTSHVHQTPHAVIRTQVFSLGFVFSCTSATLRHPCCSSFTMTLIYNIYVYM